MFQQGLEGSLRIIRFLIGAIAAAVVIAPVIQTMVCADEHSLWCGIYPACRGDSRIKYHGNSHIEAVLYVFFRITFICHRHYGEIHLAAVLLYQRPEMLDV